MALLVAAVLVLVWTFGGSRVTGHVVALVAVAGYVGLVGPSPSVVRAGVAGVLASAAWLLSRPSDPWHLYAAGLAVLLCRNPYDLLDPGFQLSFAAVAAIILVAPRFREALEGLPFLPGLRAATAVSAACTLVTAPIGWWHFGRLNLIAAVPANVLALPAVPALLWIGLAAGIVAPFSPSAAASRGGGRTAARRVPAGRRTARSGARRAHAAVRGARRGRARDAAAAGAAGRRAGGGSQPRSGCDDGCMSERVRYQHVVTVTAFVPDGGGRVLLVRPNGRGWEMPGGRVEPAEDVAQAAVREVEEETGCVVVVESLLGIDCRVSEPEMLLVRFRCRYLSGTPRPSAETPEAGWFTDRRGAGDGHRGADRRAGSPTRSLAAAMSRCAAMRRGRTSSSASSGSRRASARRAPGRRPRARSGP